MDATALLMQIEAVRGRMRRLLALEGAARLGAACLAIGLAAIALDAWVRLPPGMRLAGLAVGLWCAGRWARLHVAAPLLRPIPLTEVASRLDRALPRAEGRLRAAVERLERHEAGADELWQRVIDEAIERSAGVDLPAAVSPRPVRRAGILLLIVAALAAAAAIIWPSTATIGVPRWLLPLGMSAWPRFVEIRPLTGDVAVAAGEPATLEMRVARGAARRLKAWIVLAEPDGDERRELMTRADDDRYAYTLGRVTAGVHYWFEAGDDSTADRPGSLRVVRRPRLERAVARFAPPAYAAVLGAHTADLGESGATVLRGSSAALSLTFDKPVGRTDDGRDAIRLTRDDGAALDASAADEHRQSWRARFECDAEAALFLSMTDHEGLPLTPAPRFRVDVREDAAPRVEVFDPPPVTEVPPRAELRIVARAEDDVDVAEVRLRARTSDGVELLDRVIWSGSARRGDATAPDAGDDPHAPARLELAHAWKLAEHALPAGALVEYWLEVRDGFDWNGQRHEPAPSRVMRLRIISAEAFNERLREEYAALIRRLRLVQTEQQAAMEQSARMAERPGGDRGAAAVVEPWADAAAGQESIAAAAVGVAARLESLGVRTAGNAAAADESAAAARKLAADVRDVAKGPMERAARLLRGGSPAVDPAATGRPTDDASAHAATNGDALSAAIEAQREASEALSGLLAKLEQWTDVDSVVRRTRDLLDRQEELARRTDAETGATAGRATEQLTESQREQAERLAADQAGLADELQRMLAQVERLGDALKQRDRATAASLGDARDAAQREAPAERMRDAADAIRQNRGLRARQSQDAAAAGLRSMLSALSERSKRELAELSKNAAAAAQQLDKLIHTQKELAARTRSASRQADAALALPELSPRQRTLARSTVRLAGTLPEETPGAESAVEPIRAAAAAMNAAAAKLDDADAPGATAAQDEALAALRRAADEVSQVRDQADQAQADQDLDALRTELAAVRAAQAAVIERTAPIAQRVRPGGRSGRADGVALSRMSREQAALAERVAKAATSDAAAEVFQFVCVGIGELMQSAAERLRERAAADALELQQQAVARLTQLLADLRDAAPPKSSRYAEADGGGGGGGGPGQAARPRLVPPIAELKMLRMLQVELNSRTLRLNADAAGAGGGPAKGDARRIAAIRDLGLRQTELRELSQRMIERAREKPNTAPDANPPPTRYPAQGLMPRSAVTPAARAALSAVMSLPGQNADRAPDTAASQPVATQPSAEDAELARRLLGPARGDQDPMVRAMMLMDDSARLLTDRTETGSATQRAQSEVLKALDDAIADAARDRPGGSAGSGVKGEARQGGKRSARRAATGAVGAGQPAPGGRGDGTGQAPGAAGTPPSSAPAELRRGWGFLPPRDREAVAQGATETYHARYRARIEAYYRSLAERAEGRQ